MTAWDSTWEKVFQEREWGKYPPEELIRFVAWSFYNTPYRSRVRILDAGCGTGACTWYLAREGFSAYGIDGSKTGISIAKKRFADEGLQAEFQVGDLVQLPYPDDYFDGVVDVAALQHNTLPSIKAILVEFNRVLRAGGKLFSMVFAVGTWGYGLGDELETNTLTNIREGPLQRKGTTHFFNEVEVKGLLTKSGFEPITIERSERTLDNQKHKVSFLVVTAEKKTGL